MDSDRDVELTVDGLLKAILDAKRLEYLQANVRDAMIAKLMAQSDDNAEVLSQTIEFPGS